MARVGYRTPITIKQKCFDSAGFWKCYEVLQRTAPLISAYKLNKAENQEDKRINPKYSKYLNLEYINFIELGTNFMNIKTKYY